MWIFQRCSQSKAQAQMILGNQEKSKAAHHRKGGYAPGINRLPDLRNPFLHHAAQFLRQCLHTCRMVLHTFVNCLWLVLAFLGSWGFLPGWDRHFASLLASG